jgi:hypothetical protein
MPSQNFDVCKSVELLEDCHEFMKKKYKEMVYRELFQHLRNFPVIFK